MKQRFGGAYQRNYVPREMHSSQPAKASGRTRTGRTNPSSGRVYAASYSVSRGFSSGAAVRKRSKLLIDNIINLFETIEERWIKDMDMAKKQAMLRKKLVEHRRGLCLALVILAILSLFLFGVYKLFFVVRYMDAEGSAIYTTEEIVSASGVDLGDNLYSFREKDAESAITFLCPYLKSAEVIRGIPNRVTISTEDDTARYYAEFYGETVALSAGLKVLGEVDPSEAAEKGLTLLKVPAADKAVAGRVITFTDPRNERYIRELLANIEESELAHRIGMVDVRDPYNIQMNCDNTYRFQFGSTVDSVLKLRMAEKILKDTWFEQGSLARIDLSVTGEASVRFDLRLDLSADD